MKSNKSLKRISYIATAIAVATVTSCTNDDDLTPSSGQGDDVNRIRYALTSETLSRATLYDSSTVPDLDLIKIWSYYVNADGDTMQYFANESITASSATSTTTSRLAVGTQMWPTDDSRLTFVALADFASPSVSDPFSWTRTGSDGTTQHFGPFVDYVIDPDASQQHDLLYAVWADMARPTADNAQYVTLNFRHALSQFNFKARVSDATMSVRIKQVELRNYYNTGKIKIQSTTNTVGSGNTVTWYDCGFSKATNGTYPHDDSDVEYSLFTKFADNDAPNEGFLIDDTSTTAEALYPILAMSGEHRATSWTVGTARNPADRKLYWRILCDVYHKGETVLDGSGDTERSLLYSGWIDLGFKVTVVQGKKYTWTFVFGSGNYGYRDDDPSTPVFVPITMDVDVADWETGDGYDISGSNTTGSTGS